MITLSNRIFIGAILILRKWVTKLCPFASLTLSTLLLLAQATYADVSPVTLNFTVNKYFSNTDSWIQFGGDPENEVIWKITNSSGTVVANGGIPSSNFGYFGYDDKTFHIETIDLPIGDNYSFAIDVANAASGSYSFEDAEGKVIASDEDVSGNAQFDIISVAINTPPTITETSNIASVSETYSLPRHDLNVGYQPVAIAINPLTNRIYVADEFSSSVKVFNDDNHIAHVDVGNSPRAIAINPQTNKIYVANESSNNVTVIDGDNNGTTTVNTGSAPTAIAINPQTNKIYVVNKNSDNVTVIDGNNNSITTVNVGSVPTAIAINPDPQINKIYVANMNSSNVTVIDGNNNDTTTVNVYSAPIAIAVNPQTNKIYVANRNNNNVTVIDGNNNTTTTVNVGSATVNVGSAPTAIAINPQTNKIYVANRDSDNMTVINGNNNSTKTVAVDNEPTAIAINPRTNQIYVIGQYGTVKVIDGNTLNTTKFVTRSTYSTAIAINPQTNKIYVATGTTTSGNNLEVIDGGNMNETITSATNATATKVKAINRQTQKTYLVHDCNSGVTVIDKDNNETTVEINDGCPIAIAINEQTNKIYVALEHSYWYNVAVIDGATDDLTTIDVGNDLKAIAVNEKTNKIYVANLSGDSSNNVTVIDGDDHNNKTTIAMHSPLFIAINEETNKTYVANFLANKVTVIDGDNNTTVVLVEGYPHAIAINEETNQIYVVNRDTNNVTVIDGNSLNTTTIAVGEKPSTIGINKQTNQIYVANENSSNVTVIDGNTFSAANIYVGEKPYTINISQTNQISVTNKYGNNETLIKPLAITHPNPLTVDIGPISDDETNQNETNQLEPPVISFNTTNDIAQIYYQINSVHGNSDWVKADITSKRSGKATITESLKRGTYFLRAFATDEIMETTLNNAPATNGSLIGEISTYLFRVIPSPIVLDNGGDAHFTAVDEDIDPTKNMGTLLAIMLATGAKSDPIADGDYDAVEGIVVTKVDNTKGTWQYSIDNGTNWTDFGTPSETEARLLIDEPKTRIRFEPKTNFNTTEDEDIVEPNITFHAWEKLTGGGTNGGTVDITKVYEWEQLTTKDENGDTIDLTKISEIREKWLKNPGELIDPYALSPETETASITVTDTPEQFTKLHLETSAASILKNDTLELAGKLSVFPETGEDLSKHEIILNIILPNGKTQELKRTTTSTDTGQFKFEYNDLPSLPNLFAEQDGAFGFQATFASTPHLAESKSTTEAVLVGASAGYAILVHGKLKNEEGLAAHKKTTNRIYKTLIKRRFEAANIYYFNYNITDKDDKDTTLNEIIIGDKTTTIFEKKPTKAGIQEALTRIQTSMATTPAPLYIIMIDHGGFDGNFHIYSDNNDTGDDVILPTELDGWLTDFETGLKTKNASALKKPRIAILGYCYSGSFISDLSQQPTFTEDEPKILEDAGRIIITSATAQEESYKGPEEKDGVRSGEYFMEEFFARLNSGDNLKQAFEFATEKTETFTRRGGDSNATNRFYDDATQHPLLDDDGDGKGSNSFSAASDGHQAEEAFLGISLNSDTNSADNPAEILSVSKTIYLDASKEKSTLEAKVNDGNSVASAPVDIRKPSTVLNSSGTEASEQLEIPELSRVYMTCSGNSDTCTGEFDQFIEPGMYEAFYFVRDNETLDISPVKRSVIYKNKEGNTPPSVFDLKIPNAKGKDSNGKDPNPTTSLFVWQPSLDSDGSVTYNMIIAKDDSFSEVVYQQDELESAMTYLDETAALEDQTTYYWKVEAVDPFGERTTSLVFSFKTNYLNAPPGLGSLHISSALDFRAINGATISLVDEEGNPLVDEEGKPLSNPDIYQDRGNYNMLLPRGRRRAKIQVAGFEDQEIDLDTNQGIAELNVKMIPEGGMPIQPGQLQFATREISIDETGWKVTIFVERVNGSDGAISVNYATANGTATAGTDYTNTSGTLYWLKQDERAKTIELFITNDLDSEGDETLTITLSNPIGGTAKYPAELGEIKEITITIVDDEAAPEPAPGVLQFSSSTYSATESDTALNLSVERIDGSDGEVSIQFFTNGTATFNSDYTGGTGTLTWSDGDSTAKSLNLSLIDDDDLEESESLSLTLFNPTGDATLGSPAQATLSIADNEETGNEETGIAGTLQFSVASYTVNEGDNRTISVTRTGGSDGGVSVQYLATGDSSAMVGSDYSNASGTLTWANGDSSTKSFTVSITDDKEVENTETLKLTLSNPTGGVSLGSPAQTTLSIADNDEAGVAGTLQFFVASYTAREGNNITISVTRTGGNDGEVSVQYLATGDSTAMANRDYSNASGTLIWANGNSSAKSFTVSISDDTEVENTETLKLMLSNPTGGANLASPAQTIINITDDDIAAPKDLPKPVTTPVTTQNPVTFSPTVSGTSEAGTLQFALTTYFANENDGESQTITVTRTGNSKGNVSVQYSATANGTANSGVDYTGGFGTLTWADGDMQPKVLPLTILADDETESLETVNFMLFNPTGQATLGALAQTTLIIVDGAFASANSATTTVANSATTTAANPATAVNPNAGILQFSAPFYPATEDMGILTSLNVIRTGGHAGEVSVQYTILDNGTAVLNSDYIGGAGKLIWADGESTAKPIAIMLFDNRRLEDLKTISLMLTKPTGGASIGVPDRATLVVVDNDGQVPTLFQEEDESQYANVPSLPNLGRGIAVTKDGSLLNANVLEEMAGITVAFRGGASVNNQPYQSSLTTTPYQRVKIRGEIDIASAHIGKDADILVVVGAFNEVLEMISLFFMLDSEEQFQVWNAEPATLIGRQENVVLSKTHLVEIYQGFIPVPAQIYIGFGYRLNENGSVYFNGEQVIEVQIIDN